MEEENLFGGDPPKKKAYDPLARMRATQAYTKSTVKPVVKQKTKSKPVSNDPPKPTPTSSKKVYKKPGKAPSLPISKKNTGLEGISGYDIGYSMLPKSVDMLAAYNFGGAVNALATVERNLGNHDLQRKGLDSINSRQAKPKAPKTVGEKMNQDYVNRASKEYLNNLEKAYDRNNSFLGRAYNATNLLLTTGITQALDYAGIGIGNTLDLPDMLQSVKLPDQYSVEGAKIFAESTLFDVDTSIKRLQNRTRNALGIVDDKTTQKLNKNLDTEYNKKMQQFESRKLKNSLAEQRAIQNGTYEAEKQAYYSSKGFLLGSANYGLNKLNKAAKWVDEATGDGDNSSNWLSNMMYEQKERDDLARSQAQYIFDNKRKNEEFQKGAALLAEKYGNNKDLLLKETNALRNKIFNKQRSNEIISSNWENDKRDFLTKVFDGDNYEGFEDLIDIDNKIMPMVGQGAGTILAASASLPGFGLMGSGVKGTGSLLKNAITRTLPKQAIKEFSPITSKLMAKPNVLKSFDLVKDNLKAMPHSYAMAYDESRQIGHEVYNKAVEDKIAQATGISKEDFYKQYKPQDGQAFTPQEYSDMDKEYDAQIVQGLLKSDPKKFKAIISRANEAANLATTTNLIPETLGNLLIFNKFFKGKKLASTARKRVIPFLEKASHNPATKAVFQGAKSVGVEGFLEEAGINMYAQGKGEAYASGQSYTIDDFIKEVGSKDYMENLAAGVLMGVPQNAAMSVGSGSFLRDIKDYKEYSKILRDYKDLSKYTGQDELSKFLVNNLETLQAQEFAKKESRFNDQISDLESKRSKTKVFSNERLILDTQLQYLKEDFEAESNKLVLTKVSNALQTGTAHRLVSTLENMSKEEGISDTDKASLVDLVDTIKKLEVVYNDNLDKKDSSKIISNRFANITNTKQLLDLQQKLTQTEVERNLAIQRQTRLIAEKKATSGRADYRTKRPKKGYFMYGEKYAQEFNKALESVKTRVEEGDNFNEVSIREYRNLQESISELQSAIDNNEVEFQKLTSKEYQDKVEPRNNLYRDLSNLYKDDTLTEDDIASRKRRIISRYSNELSRVDIDAITNEVDVKIENQKDLAKAFEAQEKATRDAELQKQKEAEELEAREQAKAAVEVKKEGQPLSVENEEELANKAASRQVPEEVLSEEERVEIEEEKNEILNKDELTQEDSERLNELEEKGNAQSTRETLDELLGEKVSETTELNQREESFLSSLGIDPEVVRATPSYRAENIATTERDSGGAVAINVEDNDDYSPNIIDSNKDYQNPFKSFIEQLIYGVSLKNKIPESEVTAEDVLDRLITIAGKDKAEQAWNIFTEGYSLAKPDNTVNFDRLYSAFFTNELATLDNLLDQYTIPQSVEGEIERPIDYSEETSAPEVLQETPVDNTPKFDSNNKPIISGIVEEVPADGLLELGNSTPENRTNNYRVNRSHLILGTDYMLGILETMFNSKAVFQRQNFKGFHLNNLFNLHNYKKYKSNKLPMVITKPDNYRDLIVKLGREHGWKKVPFSEWEQLYPQYPEGSPEWVAKVPMIASFEGQPTFQINDATASVTMDIIERGEGDSMELHKAKKAYFTKINNEIRNHVLTKGSHNVLVQTDFKDLAEKQLPSSRPLSQFSKDNIIGMWDAKSTVFKVNGKVFPTINKIFSNFAEHNAPVIIKPVGIYENGDIQYQAFQVKLSGLLTKNHTASVASALYAYLGRNIKDTLSPEVKNFRDTLKNEANIDLENYVDLNNYIRSISKTSYFADQAVRLGLTELNNEGITIENKIKDGFAKFINDPTNNAEPGQPMIAIVDYKVVFALKPPKGVSATPQDIVVVDPINITSQEQLIEASKSIINPYYKALNKTATSINVNQNMLSGNKPYFLINSAKADEVIKYDTYDDYIRAYIQVPGSASIRSMTNLDGTVQDVMGKYAIIKITQEGGFEQSFEEFVGEKQQIQEEKNKTEEAKKILETKEQEKPVEERQEVSNEQVEELKEKIKKAEKTRDALIKNNVPIDKVEALLSKLKNDYKELTGEENTDNFSPNIITNEQVEDMLEREKSNFKDIKGLSLYERQDIVNYIFNDIAGSIGYQKGSKISKNKILSDVKNKLSGVLNQTLESNNETLNLMREFGDDMLESVKDLEQKNLVLQSVLDNYESIESDVLELLEERVGIKEVKDKSKGDSIKDENATVDSEDVEDDPTENSDEDLTSGNDIDKDLVDRDKHFNSSNLEVKGKATVSAKMKRFLAKIPVVNKSGGIEKGFLDLPRYYDFRDLDNEIKVALNTPIEIDSDFEQVKALLASPELQEKYSWAKPLLERLVDPKTPEQTRIEFMYNYTGRHAISSKFIEFEMQPNGRFVTKIFDANYTDIAKNIRKEWEDGVKNSKIYNATDDGSYSINPNIAKSLYDTYLNIISQLGESTGLPIAMNNISNKLPVIQAINAMVSGDSLTVKSEDIPSNMYKEFMKQLDTKSKLVYKINNKELIEVSRDYDNNIIYSKPKLSDNVIENLFDWTKAVGLDINASTLTDIAQNGLDLGRKKGILSFYDLLDIKNFNSPLSRIAENLRLVEGRAELNQSLDIKDFNILQGSGDSLLSLAKIESKYTNRVVTKNFRDNNKLMQGLPIGKYATDRVKELKDPNSGLLDKLSKFSFSKNSLVGKLLRDPEFSEKFIIAHTANGSFKEKDGRFQKNAKVTDLTSLDLETAKLAFFFETNNVGRYNQSILEDFKQASDTRMGHVFLPTMSDKDQMMTIQTLIFNINEGNYKGGDLSPAIKELLYSQLVKPDLERIQSFHNKVQGKTDIKGYDEAAQLFNLLPSLNLITDENGDTLPQLMKRNPSLYTSQYIENNFKREILNEVNNLVNHLVNQKLESWKDLEVIDSKGNIKVNADYLSTRKEDKKNKEVLNRNIAAEFIINNLITNANMHMLVIGDPALYSQSKFFNEDRFEDGDPTIPIHPNVYREWSESSLGTNLGKRLALMLAPGNKIYNSKDDLYDQIYLKDFVDISSNILDLIQDFYGVKERDRAEGSLKEIEEYNKILSQDNNLTPEEIKGVFDLRKNTIKALQKEYGKLADYFDIESTDAQEYTTISEHINVMRRQGRIEDSKFEEISKKLKAQQKEADKGLPISLENYLSKEELGFVLQPIKPVYTGQIYDEAQDVARVIYIKSSSFPLIPQLTYGKPIDGVRRVLEEYEATNGKSIRASYDTANKVGATKNALSPFNPDGSFNEFDFNIGNLVTASLELNRNNFRIQQDVPYKSDKGSEDRISYGTQMLKVLFSNGVINVKSGFLNPSWDLEDMDNNTDTPKDISARKLFDRYNNAFVSLVESKRNQLYKELGVGENGFVKDEDKFKKSIARLLEKEGKKRDYSKNDLNSIKLTENGEFVLPLFLNNQSGKIESLLLSIISSRVIKHKLPGYSYVAGSEAGFKLNKTEDFEGIEGADKIIYTEDFSGSLKGTVNSGTGNIEFAEVMVPSKLRNNKGEMLDLYSKDKSGEYRYITVDPETKRYILKKDANGNPMIQKHLLNLVTFRIPTSSHVSLSNVKIVGILPPEAGDLIIVPKNFTKQKGLDFDVDKENTYQLWTYVNQNGRVKELSQGYIDYLVKKLGKVDQAKLERLKQDDSESHQELLSALGTEEALQEFIDNKELSMADKMEDLKLAMKQKLIENEIIKIHSSVLGNPNLEVKNKINKILSMDFAKEQAENISNLKEVGRKNKFINSVYERSGEDGIEVSKSQLEESYRESNKYFTILSDEYQSYKMFLGSAGKSGIGVYSNFLTMSSLMQQYGNTGDFRLMEYDPLEKSYNQLNFAIGGIGQVDGVLGRIKTLDGSRTISEVFEELQNTATDNEKEQIMGRTGINSHTIAVFSMMSMLGIDKTPISAEIVKKFGLDITDNKMSFGNLLLSQDIVSEIVSKLEHNNSTLTDFDNRQVIDIIKDYKKKLKVERVYAEEGEVVYDDDGNEVSTQTLSEYDLLTGDNLIKSLGGERLEYSEDFKFQVLDFLEKMYSFENQFRSAQKILNISSNGLGLDLIEANNYNQLLAKVVNNNPKNNMISGIEKLLFDITEDAIIPEGKEGIDYFRVNEFPGKFIIPTTPIGASIINSFVMSKRLYGEFFPYQNIEYRRAVELARSNTNISGNSQSKLDFERRFAKEYKKYLFSNNPLSTGSIRAERERLFFDTQNNTSLALYLKNLKETDNEILEYSARNLLNNPLIKKLTFDINSNNKKNTKNRFPSTIKYNDANSIVENREVLYRALPELLESTVALPPFNGKDYNTRQFAQDLILYSFLEGGIQEIQQFVKYVPVSYLEVMGFTKEIRDRYNDTRSYLSLKDGQGNFTTPSFIRQFFQHNPEYVSQIKSFDKGLTYAEMKAQGKFNAATSTELVLSEETQNKNRVSRQNFIAIKDPQLKGKNKTIIFERDPSDKTRFVKRDSAGYYGLSEYDSTKRVVRPLKIVIADNLPDKPNTRKTNNSNETSNGTLTESLLESNNSKQIAEKVLELNNEYSEILKPFINLVSDSIDVIIDPSMEANGVYSSANNTIRISSRVVEKGDLEVSKILTKEFIHSLTTNYVSLYLTKEGKYKNPQDINSVPPSVRKLKTLYHELLKGGATLKNESGVSLWDFVKSYTKGTSLTTETFDTFYGFTNVFEFIEMSMTSPEFRDFLDQISDQNSKDRGMGFLQRLKEAFKDLWSEITNKTVSKEVVDTISDLILSSELDPFNISDNIDDNLSPFDRVTNVLSQVRSLLDNDISGNFALMEQDPFIC